MNDIIDVLALEFELTSKAVQTLQKNENDLSGEEEELFLGSIKGRLEHMQQFIRQLYESSSVPEPRRRRMWQLALSDRIVENGFVGIIDSLLYEMLGRHETFSMTHMVKKNPGLDRQGLLKTGSNFTLCRLCHVASLVAIVTSVVPLLTGQMLPAIVMMLVAVILDVPGRQAQMLRPDAILAVTRPS
jgi:hypothetical protein